jgi:hypothetical protein
MSSENGEHTFKLKLKLTAPLVRHATSRQGDGDADVRLVVAPMDTNPDKPLHIGARGGAALKELLATAPNPEEAIRAYQATHGLNFATKTVNKRHGEADANGSNKKPRAETVARFAPAEKLLDLLQVSRSTVYESLLDKLLKEMLLRIEELSQDELQRMLEVTFPYIEFRELRKIPIAILARQDDTPEAYLRELTENRRILGELPIHVRRKIMHVDKQELQYFVEQCTQEYVTETLDWYLKHPTLAVASTATSASSSSTVSTARKSFSMESQLSFGRSTSNGAASNSSDLWNVTSHMPSPSSRSSTQTATEDRRRQSAALAALSEMIGDSDALYLSTLDILQEYVVTANIPGTVATASAKDYVDYVPFLGALRSDLANLQRDKTTTQMRTDPLHKFIWFLDRAVKHPNAMEVSQLHELLSVIKKLRVGDVPLNKKFKKKSDVQEEEDNFEIVLGPPPVDQLLVVLDKIAKTDVRVIFAEPVPDDVPGYRDIIKEPMDLSTMRKKAKKGKYKTLEMFTDDFNLMIKNCMTFNPDTTVFYKDGKRIGKRGLEIIEKHATTLRGEPQRIRAKKRKKSGPAETMTMLTSAGVVTLKDFGDFDQTGMVPEGICDEALADVALILSDPHVKQMLCDSLLKTLVVCWQKRELPTDNLMCRGLVQLLQVGNPASVRRMLRKKDYVLRAPQVVTMRVVLPLLIRSMATYRIGFSGTGLGAITRESKALKDDLVEATLWTNMLRASSTIRSVTKAFVLHSLKDHQVDVAVHLLELLKLVEDEILYRDRVFLHALGEIGLQDVKTYSSSSDLDTAPMTANGGGFESLKTSAVWKSVVEGFFISSLRTRTLAAKESNGSIIEYEELDDGDEAEPSKDDATVTKQHAVRSFPLPILHEKTAMVLSSAVLTLEKNGSIVDARVVATYLRRTLGMTRAACLSLDEFEMLWRSQVFQQCRSFYEPLLSRCPDLSKEIFSAEYCTTSQEEEEEKADVKPKIEPTAGSEGAARNPSMAGGEEEELEAGEVDEEEGAVEG